jgi:hypothetical protein|tara:strand:+ start:4494 stop:5081 length:588 start_codon:yes stop_codon:yes gene_type:complete
MHHYINIIKDTPFTEDEINTAINLSTIGLLEDETKYTTYENTDGQNVLTVELHRQLDVEESDDFVEDLELVYNKQGLKDYVVEVSNNDPMEETYNGDDFFEAYGDMWFSEDETLDEAEYQGRKVKLGKPMQGDVKKFKVYVRDPKTKNVKKVNFGDPNMRIKKSNPARRRSFRARHNCASPGPRTKARYWSCRKW